MGNVPARTCLQRKRKAGRPGCVCWRGTCDIVRTGGHLGTPGCGLPFENLRASPGGHKTTLGSSHCLPKSEIKCAIKAQQAKGSLVTNRRILKLKVEKRGMSFMKRVDLLLWGWRGVFFLSVRKRWFGLTLWKIDRFSPLSHYIKKNKINKNGPKQKCLKWPI